MPSVGPQLPPHLSDKRKRDDEGEDELSPSTSPEGTSKRPRVMGPAPPPAPLEERPHSPPIPDNDAEEEESTSSSDDDDDFGPALPTTADANKPSITPQATAVQTQSVAPAKRDEWMTIAPTSGDWSSRVDPTKLKNRKFGSGKGPVVSAGDGDSWHETPEQKQARLHREMMGITDDSKTKHGKSDVPNTNSAEAATKRRIKEHNSARGPSLYQAHQGTTKADEEDDPSARAFDREKDIVSIGGVLNEDFRPDNVIIQCDEAGDYRAAVTDLAQARLRREDESDQEWLEHISGCKMRKSDKGSLRCFIKAKDMNFYPELEEEEDVEEATA